MIVGIGNDIIEIKRIEKAILQKRFLEKCFTRDENIFFDSKKINIQSVAGSFAAKEAVAKSLGTGFLNFSLIDVEILHDKKGMPYVILYRNAEALTREKNINKIYISISHCIEYATAYAVAES